MALLARLVRTGGPGKQAILEIEGCRYEVRDGFSWVQASAPAPGATFEVELSPSVQAQVWEEVFSGNPDQTTGLSPAGGGAYTGFGRIIAVEPVVVDCGLLRIDGVVQTRDVGVIGEFVAFTIDCIDAFAG